eukprot:349990-Chlamydomonas_euryale.AAC.13
MAWEAFLSRSTHVHAPTRSLFPSFACKSGADASTHRSQARHYRGAATAATCSPLAAPLPLCCRCRTRSVHALGTCRAASCPCLSQRRPCRYRTAPEE